MLIQLRRVSPAHRSAKPGNRNGSPPDMCTRQLRPSSSNRQAGVRLGQVLPVQDVPDLRMAVLAVEIAPVRQMPVELPLARSLIRRHS